VTQFGDNSSSLMGNLVQYIAHSRLVHPRAQIHDSALVQLVSLHTCPHKITCSVNLIQVFLSLHVVSWQQTKALLSQCCM
jgi:hypothetical protein